MNNVIKFDVDNVNELAEVIGNEADEGNVILQGTLMKRLKNQ